MRFNRLCLTFALPCALLTLLSCSRTDVLTDAGASVAVGADPAQTGDDPWRGFARVTFDSSDLHPIPGEIVYAFSLPAARDPMFGTYTGLSNMLIGVSDENDTVAAHMQYEAKGGAYLNLKDTIPELAAAFIHFRSKDTVESVKLFLSDPLGEFAPVNKTADIDNDMVIGSFSLRGADGGDSVRLPDDIAYDMFEARMSSGAGAPKKFAFSIVDYTEKKILKLDKPYIVITFIKRFVIENEEGGDPVNDSSAVYDTIVCSSVRHTVFESAEAEKRAITPYSSQLTRRTAVFRINMKKMFEKLDDKGLPVNNIVVMNAAVAVKPNNSESKNAGNYLALVLDTLLPKEMLSDTAAAKKARLLRDEFKGVEPIGVTAPYNTHDFKPVLRDVVDEYIRRSADKQYKPYIYVYLRPVTEGSVIVWDNKSGHGPQKIETVFTHSR